ncbi:hypothetical protein D3C72_1442050 [compost metagenome]
MASDSASTAYVPVAATTSGRPAPPCIRHSTPSAPTSRMALTWFSTPDANSRSEWIWYRLVAPARILPRPMRLRSSIIRLS